MEARTIIAAVVGAALFASVSTASLLYFSGENSAIVATDQQALLARLLQVEKELQVEREARLGLEEIISKPSFPGIAEISASVGEDAEDLELSENFAVNPLPSTEPGRSQFQERMSQRTAQLQPEYRKQRLIAAGFAQEEAAGIIQLESEIALKELQDQYNLRREYLQQQGADGAQQMSTSAQLRAQLGDDYYQRYLYANGWPTAVSIDTVMHASPGQNAGLRPGDKVTAYDGKRVFDIQDLHDLTVQGTVGESVLIEVERDGDPLQLTMPRGPIGISGGRGRFGR